MLRVNIPPASEKRVVVGADFAGFPLKEAIKKHLIQRGWTVEDLTAVLEETPMYQRAGFMVGARIAEHEFEKGLAFCGTGTVAVADAREAFLGAEPPGLAF